MVIKQKSAFLLWNSWVTIFLNNLSTVRILLPRTKTYPFHYFKIKKKGLFLAPERTYTKIFIQIEWQFEYFFALRKHCFTIRFSRVSGYFWCLLYIDYLNLPVNKHAEKTQVHQIYVPQFFFFYSTLESKNKKKILFIHFVTPDLPVFTGWWTSFWFTFI